jgi:hypothetical protein
LEKTDELENVKGTTLSAFLLHARALLDLADAIITITDKHKRDEMMEELRHAMGEKGPARVPGVGASLTEDLALVTKITSGIVSVCATVAGITAKLAGEGAEAAKCFAIAGKVASKAGPILSVIEVIHGVFVTANPKANAVKKEEAGRDIALGGVG